MARIAATEKTWTVDVARLLRVSAHELWLATLIGEPPPSLRRLQARIMSISPGDLVAEITTAHQRECDEYAVGRLVACRREAFRWARGGPHEAEDFLRQSEVAWYLELLDGKLFRWSNASFIRILETHDDAIDWLVGVREARDDINRAWVTAALALHDIDSLAAQQPCLKTPIEAVDVEPPTP